MDPDGVSLSCDDGAHERCAGCACGCHAPQDSWPGSALGGPGQALVTWAKPPRQLIVLAAAAIPGMVAIALLLWAGVLTLRGLL